MNQSAIFDSSFSEGPLKQQCLDSQGLYFWEKKWFKLDIPTQNLYINVSGESTEVNASVSLRGAKHAKEWSFSSSLAGFGFDLVWYSGIVWSFLVDSEVTCKNWVNSFNKSLSFHSTNPNGDSKEDLRNHISDVPVCNNENSNIKFREYQNLGKVQQSSTATHLIPSQYSDIDSNSTSPTEENKWSGDHLMKNGSKSNTLTQYRNENTGTYNDNSNSVTNDSNMYTQNINNIIAANDSTADANNLSIYGNTNNISNKSNRYAGQNLITSSTDSMILSDFSQQHDQNHNDLLIRNNYTVQPSESYKQHIKYNHHHQQQEQQEEELEEKKLVKKVGAEGRSNIISPPLLPSFVSSSSSSSTSLFLREIASLQERCTHLEALLEHKQKEVDSSKNKLTLLQQKYDANTVAFEEQLRTTHDKERQILLETKREMESKLLRMSNDNSGFYEAANTALKLQHSRELDCLREELAEERKKHSSLFEKAESQRVRAELAEQQAKKEVQLLYDQLNTLRIDCDRSLRECEADRASIQRDRDRMQADYDATTTRLQAEKQQISEQAQQELRSKLEDMNIRMQRSIQSMQSNEIEIVRQELEGIRLRSIAEMQRQCQKEIEIVRTEERRLAAAEMENMRNAFLSREHQTSEDLIQLEKLHTLRVNQLEQQVTSLKASQQEIEATAIQYSKEAQQGNGHLQRATKEMQLQMEQYASEAEALHRELVASHVKLQECQAKEHSYRDQLSKALTQHRLQYAELAEAKQQAAAGNAEATRWRNVSKESTQNTAAAETAMHIARDEVMMLEHTLRRLESENSELKNELNRADRLIYGVPQPPLLGQHFTTTATTPPLHQQQLGTSYNNVSYNSNTSKTRHNTTAATVNKHSNSFSLSNSVSSFGNNLSNSNIITPIKRIRFHSNR